MKNNDIQISILEQKVKPRISGAYTLHAHPQSMKSSLILTKNVKQKSCVEIMS